MAKVIISNTREHAIHLNVGKDSVLIPGAKQNPNDRSKIINGTEMVDSEFLNAARKHPVAGHYFREGWLRVQGGDNSTSKPPNPNPPIDPAKDNTGKGNGKDK